jgi:hypothetical protein
LDCFGAHAQCIARVTTLNGTPEDVDNGIDNFRANVVPFASEQGKGAILLVDRASGEAFADHALGGRANPARERGGSKRAAGGRC